MVGYSTNYLWWLAVPLLLSADYSPLIYSWIVEGVLIGVDVLLMGGCVFVHLCGLVVSWSCGCSGFL